MKVISIQGNLGSYSHIAAKHLHGDDIELLQRETFKEVFEDLSVGRCDVIVIPIENSTYGSVFQNYDLMSKYSFYINKEIYLKINFHLIVNPGTPMGDIYELYTHPVGLGQIKEFLEDHPKIKPVEYHDTAGSVEFIKSKQKVYAAAAASRLAAELNEMEILQENIQENQNNYTRFFSLSKLPPKEEDIMEEKFKKPKTSIQFELGEESGSLFKALEPFAKKDIALVKIESRPIINTHWKFTFYIDVRAGVYEKEMKQALAALEKAASKFRVLGCYDKGEYIET